MVVRYVKVNGSGIFTDESSILVILRDRGLPLPAGAILISPWVDLTHSFPSVAGDNSLDYIPSHGFLQRPSASWPPPNTDDMEQIAIHAVEQVVGEGLPRKSSQAARREATEDAVQGFSVDHNPKYLNPRENADNPFGADGAGQRPGNTIPGIGHDLSIMLGGNLVHLKDQIQMYTTNQLISHPLVSPVLQPSLGGLPPLLIVTGGGEVLRDEQIYLAHKAANPSKYPPGDAYLDEYPEARDSVSKWIPTDVQLQVWDDLCHVAPTLSFTRPAKFMYRSIAQFGAWVLARAQKTEIQIMDDDEVSIISSGSDTESESEGNMEKPKQTKTTMKNGVAQGGTAASDQIGKAGEPLPSFKNHMIRQRVNRHGHIFPLDPALSLPALQISANEIGVIKPGPVQKWLDAKKQWDTKYAREKRKVQKQRAKEMAKGYEGFGNDDVPPPSALAGRRGLSMPKVEKKRRSWLMSLWSLWGSSHDENTVCEIISYHIYYSKVWQIQREEKADKDVGKSTTTDVDGANARPANAPRAHRQSRSRSRRRVVSDTGQANNESEVEVNENTPAAEPERRREYHPAAIQPRKDPEHLSPPKITPDLPPTDTSHDGAGAQLLSSGRPTAGPGKAFPFKLGAHLVDNRRNASTVTLQSQAGVVTPKADPDKETQLGDSAPNANEGKEHDATKNDVGKQLEEPAESGIEHDTGKLAEQPVKNSIEARRGTLEDARGVLHHGPVVSKEAEKAGVNEEVVKRPELDRADTASLD